MFKNFILIFLCFSSVASYAKPNREELIREASKSITANYSIDKEEITPAVQILNILGHKLEKEPDTQKAINIAKTIIGITSKGKGVGGLRKPTDRHAYLNKPEEKLFLTALDKALMFFKEQKLLDSKGAKRSSDEFIKDKIKRLSDDPEGKNHPTHFARIKEILSNPSPNLEEQIFSFNSFIQQEVKSLEEKESKLPNSLKLVNNRIQELEADNFNIKTWEAIDQILQETVKRENCLQLSKSLIPILKQLDLKKIFYKPNTNPDYLPLKSIIERVLINLEKFRMLEVIQPGFDKIDPKVSDYRDDKADSENQAILAALISAIQNYIYNPVSTVDDLKRLFGYEANRKFWTHLGDKDRSQAEALIDEQLLEQLSSVTPNINKVQKLDIDKKTAQQKMMFYSVPHFNISPTESRVIQTFMHHFPSSGDDMQCGFFSLAFKSREEKNEDNTVTIEGRQEAIEQILDNLQDPYIFMLADKTIGLSATIKSHIDKFINEFFTDKEKEIIDIFFERFAIKNNISLDDPSFEQNFKEKYLEISEKVASQESQIEAEYEKARDLEGLPSRIPGDDDGTIADKIRVLKEPYQIEKWLAQSEFIKLFYDLDKFKIIVKDRIDRKFRIGLLEFDPNPEWDYVVPSFPYIMGYLNNFNIYNWVSDAQFKHMQCEQNAHITIPIHNTEDNQYHLVNALVSRNTGLRMSLINKSGIHYEKWIEADQYARLANAIRHNNKYRL